MSDCYCDFDPPEFFHREIRRALKPHRCTECSGEIAIGETYEHVRGKWDGYIDTINTCSRCVDLKTWVRNNVPCFCWAYGNMHDDAREAVDEACLRAPGEVAGLRFGLSRRLYAIKQHNRVSRGAEMAPAH